MYSLPQLLRAPALLVLVIALVVQQPALFAQASEQSNRQPQVPVAPAVLELQKRLAETDKAQRTGDPAVVARANRRLIALALREMAHLRLLESANQQAVELYQRSLDMEDDPNTRVDLAVSYLRMSRASDAIGEAEKVIYSAPDNARAWNVEGKAWMLLKDYRNASKFLSHSIRLKGDVESAYSLATCLLLLHDKDNAALVFQDIVNNVGDRGSIHILIGRAYRDAGFMDDAIKEFNRALAVDPHTPHAHYFIGLIQLIQNEWAPNPAIRQQMQEELKIDPRDYLANYVLGVFASNEKQYEDSDSHLKIASEEDPKAPESWMYMGLNAYSRGDLKAAEGLLRKSIELTGKDEARSHYQIRKAYIALGRVLIETGRKEDGAVALQKARQIQQLGMNESQQGIAEVFASSGSGMGAVMPYLAKDSDQSSGSELLSGDPAGELDASALQRANLTAEEMKLAMGQEKQLRGILGSSYNDLGAAEAIQQHYQQALAEFRQAEDWDPQVPNLMRNLGFAAAKVGDSAVAVRALSQHLATDPQDAAARRMLGMSYFLTADYANAAKTIDAIGEAAMNDPGLAYAWASALVHIGDLKRAAKVMESMEQHDLPADTLLLLGQTWSDAGDYMHASQTFQKAALKNPRLARAHFFAGLALLHAEHPEGAAAEFESELQLSPADNEARYNLGYTCLLRSQTDKAAEIFASVLRSDPDHSNAHYQLGKIFLDEGKLREAIAHLEAAERLTPEKDFVHLQLQAAYRKSNRAGDAERELALYKELKAKNRLKTLPQPGSEDR